MWCNDKMYYIFVFYTRPISPPRTYQNTRDEPEKKTASGGRHLTPIKGEMDEMHVL